MNTTRIADSDSEHPGDHETLLQAAFAADPSHDDARWSVIRNCPTCAQRLRALEATQRLLDSAGQDRDAVLRRLVDAGPTPGEDLVAPFVRNKLAAERASGARPLLSFRAWAATAAAAALVIGWFARQWITRSESSARGVLLGDQSDAGLSPSGDVTSFLPFEWRLELPPGGSFTLTIWDRAIDDPEQPLSRMTKLKENKAWIAGETVASWPIEIGWQVEARDATGVPVGAPRRAYARLRRP